MSSGNPINPTITPLLILPSATVQTNPATMQPSASIDTGQSASTFTAIQMPPSQAALPAAPPIGAVITHAATPPTRSVRGKPFPSKEYSLAIREWLQDLGPAPSEVWMTSKADRGRLYLCFISEQGIIEFNGLKKETSYLLAFFDEEVRDGNITHVNKIVERQEEGTEIRERFFFRENGIYHKAGKSIERTQRIIGAEVRAWLDGGKLPQSGGILESDEQGRLFISNYMESCLYVVGSVEPSIKYTISFGEDEPESKDYSEKDLWLKLTSLDGSLKDKKYFFRFHGKFYFTARPEQLARRDILPEEPPLRTVWHERRERSKSVLKALDGKIPLPITITHEVQEDGRVLLATLDNGKPIRLSGLGRDKRSCTIELRSDGQGSFTAEVKETSGDTINHYLIKTPEHVFTDPTPELPPKEKRPPEVAFLLAQIGLDSRGKLLQPTPLQELDAAIAEIPFTDDSILAAWYAQKLRVATGSSLSLGYFTQQLWLNKKIARNEIKGIALIAGALDLYLSLTPEQQDHTGHLDTYPSLFERLRTLQRGQRLSYLTTAMFAGGAIAPRHHMHFHHQLARAYEYAVEHPWLLKAPDFGDSFGKAVRYLAKNQKEDRNLRLKVLSLMATGKLSQTNIRLRIIALNLLQLYLPNISEWLEELAITEGLSATNIREKFSPELFDRGHISPELRETILELLVGLCSKNLSVLPLLSREERPTAAPRSEKELYEMSKDAPEFSDPVKAATWLMEQRIADYSLATHVSYLLYCNKIPSDMSHEFFFMAGAFDWVANNNKSVVADIKEAIDTLPADSFPTPYTISAFIRHKGIWTRRDNGRPLGKNFAYLAVMAAFHLNFNELFAYVRQNNNGREPVVLTDKIFTQSRLLTQEEQRQLADIRKRHKDKGERRLTKEETLLLTRLVKVGSRRAQDMLLYFYEPMMMNVINRRRMGILRWEELLQTCRIKLIELAKRWNPSGKASFMYYAITSLEWYVLSDEQRASGTIYKPAHYIEELQRIKKIRAALSSKNKDPVSDDELAAALGISLEELRFKLSLDTGSVYLEDKVGEDSERKEFIPDSKAGPAAIVEDRHTDDDIRRAIDEALNGLLERERTVIRRRFLSDDSPTLEVVGQEMGYTRERIRQIEAEALKKLKKDGKLRELMELMKDRD